MPDTTTWQGRLLLERQDLHKLAPSALAQVTITRLAGLLKALKEEEVPASEVDILLVQAQTMARFLDGYGNRDPAALLEGYRGYLDVIESRCKVHGLT